MCSDLANVITSGNYNMQNDWYMLIHRRILVIWEEIPNEFFETSKNSQIAFK